MAGKKKKQVPKRSKKKSIKKNKNSKKTDLKQQKLNSYLTKASTSAENLHSETTESFSTNSSFTADLRCQLSGTTLSSGSSGMKRRCTEQGGPLAKRPLVETSHESLEDIDEEEFHKSLNSSSEEENVCESDDTTHLPVDDDIGELENRNFIEYQQQLNSVETQPTANKPSQLNERLCKGVGDPSEIWRLMCKKDDLQRINVSELSENIDRQIRAVLVDWMMEVCENEKQHRETFHLSVNYLDRVLAVDKEITVAQLQCLGTVTLFLASKYEEIYPPKLECFVEYTDGACSRDQVENMEQLVLDRLQWSLSVMTSVHWLNTFCQLMGSKKVEEEDAHYSEKPILLPKYLRDQFMNMAKILDIAVMDLDHLQFSYRQLAAAVLFVDYEPHSLVEDVTGYTYEEMQPVIEWISSCYNPSETRSPTGDSLPAVADVSSEEWHNIQTHGRLTVEKGFNDVCSRREEEEKRRKEVRKRYERRRPRKTLRQTNAPMAV